MPLFPKQNMSSEFARFRQMPSLHYPVIARQEPKYQIEHGHDQTSSIEGYAKMQKTSQSSVHVEIGKYSSFPSPCAIEIEENTVRKLTQMCAEQDISVKDLVSTLLQRMLLDHHRETKDILEKFRCHPLR